MNMYQYPKYRSDVHSMSFWFFVPFSHCFTLIINIHISMQKDVYFHFQDFHSLNRWSFEGESLLSLYCHSGLKDRNATALLIQTEPDVFLSLKCTFYEKKVSPDWNVGSNHWFGKQPLEMTLLLPTGWVIWGGRFNAILKKYIIMFWAYHEHFFILLFLWN